MGYDGGDDIADYGSIGLNPQGSADDDSGGGSDASGGFDDELMQPETNDGEGPVPQEAIDQANADQVFDRSIDKNYQDQLNFIAGVEDGGDDTLGRSQRTAEAFAMGTFDQPGPDI